VNGRVIGNTGGSNYECKGAEVVNIVFDLGGVLIRWEPDTVAAEYSDNSEIITLVREQLFKHADWKEYDRGAISTLEMVRRAADRTGLSEEALETLMNVVISTLHPLDSTVTLFENLHKAGYPLYCCSNIPEMFITPLERDNRFFELFWGKVYSSRIGSIKPEPEIYTYLLSTFGLEPEQTVFIDDIQENVEGAREVGMKAIRFTSAEECSQALQFFGIRW
jgi:putative hydrolase of the HAD superfamily